MLKQMVFAVTLMIALAASPVAAASPTGQCFFGPLNHTAMQGRWVADDGYEFAFNIYPCGGRSELFWLDEYDNFYSAEYRSVDVINGGGWIGTTLPGNTGPWYTSVIGYKPAERNKIQLVFWAPNTPEQFIVRHATRG